MGTERGKRPQRPENHFQIDEYPSWFIRTVGTLSIAMGSVYIAGTVNSLITNFEETRLDSAAAYGLTGVALAVFGGFAFSRVRAPKNLREQR